MIQAKRIYDPPAADDGARILVDRLWPRGVRKDAARLDGWLKEVAPSDQLRRWFNHTPEKWDEFQRRYFDELEARPRSWKPLAEAARHGDVALLFGASDRAFNNAVALKRFLEEKLGAVRSN